MNRTAWKMFVIALSLPAFLAVRADAEPDHGHHGHGAQAPMSSLAQDNTRQPLYLLPMMAEHQKQNMREHLAAVNEVVAALARSDYKTVESAAKKLGTSPAMQQMCMHMGAATAGFAKRALAFHETADNIGAAAKTQNSAAVLTALNRTLDHCVACHAGYRQEVVDDARWRELTRKQ